jgi:hypothetical protein
MLPLLCWWHSRTAVCATLCSVIGSKLASQRPAPQWFVLLDALLLLDELNGYDSIELKPCRAPKLCAVFFVLRFIAGGEHAVCGAALHTWSGGYLAGQDAVGGQRTQSSSGTFRFTCMLYLAALSPLAGVQRWMSCAQHWSGCASARVWH